MSWIGAIGMGWLAMALVMLALWFLQRRTGDAGIVDVAWGLGVGGLALYFCLFIGDGDAVRRAIILVVALVWSLRLSGYVLWRVVTMPEDGRYRALKEQWGREASWRMFRFYQFQALGAVLFALPMLIAAFNPAPLSWVDYVGMVVGVLAIVGEMVADWQLSRFRSRPQNRGEVCQDGLWYYSRHPNYFFEWLHWWAYWLLAIGYPFGWLNLIFPVAMFFFITRVTGIPPTEQQALRSRGEKYRAYQQSTSAFFPLPRKRQPESTEATQGGTS